MTDLVKLLAKVICSQAIRQQKAAGSYGGNNHPEGTIQGDRT
jgi:hypothetical protein